MGKLTRNLVFMLAAVFFCAAGAVWAQDHKEAAAKIEELNKRIEEAGEKNDLQTAIEAAEDALTVAVQAFGSESLEAARAMNNAANLYMFARRPIQAGNLYRQAVDIQISKKGKNDPEVADYSYNLAMALAMQAKYDDARAALKRTIEIRKKKLGKEHPETLKAEEMLKEIG